MARCPFALTSGATVRPFVVRNLNALNGVQPVLPANVHSGRGSAAKYPSGFSTLIIAGRRLLSRNGIDPKATVCSMPTAGTSEARTEASE